MINKNSSWKCRISDVAELAGVATSTVSRVLNGRNADSHTSESTRIKIFEAAAKLNYVPNVNARRLFSKKAEVIALVLPSYEFHRKHVLTDHHLAGVFSGLEIGLAGSGYRLLIVFNDERFEKSREYLSLFRQNEIDGMLIWGPYENQQFWNELPSDQYPVMFLSPPRYMSDNINYVFHDYENAGKSAAEYLIQRGHKEIAWIGGSDNNGIVIALEKGIRKFSSECHIWTEYGDFSRDSGRQIVERLAVSRPWTTALLAVNTDVAEGAKEVLERLDLNWDIIACDSATEAEGNGMAHICVDDRKLGEIAVRSLLDLLGASAKTPIQKKLNVKLYHCDYV